MPAFNDRFEPKRPFGVHLGVLIGLLGGLLSIMFIVAFPWALAKLTGVFFFVVSLFSIFLGVRYGDTMHLLKVYQDNRADKDALAFGVKSGNL